MEWKWKKYSPNTPLGHILWSLTPRSRKITGSCVDPTSVVAMESSTQRLYFTKLSGKSLDFDSLVGTHLNLYKNIYTTRASIQENVLENMFNIISDLFRYHFRTME